MLPSPLQGPPAITYVVIGLGPLLGHQQTIAIEQSCHLKKYSVSSKVARHAFKLLIRPLLHVPTLLQLGHFWASSHHLPLNTLLLRGETQLLHQLQQQQIHSPAMWPVILLDCSKHCRCLCYWVLLPPLNWPDPHLGLQPPATPECSCHSAKCTHK